MLIGFGMGAGWWVMERLGEALPAFWHRLWRRPAQRPIGEIHEQGIRTVKGYGDDVLKHLGQDPARVKGIVQAALIRAYNLGLFDALKVRK